MNKVPFIQEVSGEYTSPCLGTEELKMALWARKVSGAFEQRTPVPRIPKWATSFLVMDYSLMLLANGKSTDYCVNLCFY